MSGTPAEGRVEEILVYPERRAPARECEEVIAVSGVGLAGDHRRNPSRAVTLLSIEAWEEAMALLGADLPPRARRGGPLRPRGAQRPHPPRRPDRRPRRRVVSQFTATGPKERQSREERRVRTGLKLSGLPVGKTLDTFDFAF